MSHILRRSPDKILMGIVLILVVGGFFIFSSASLGLLARDGAQYSSVAFNQLFFGVIGGIIALLFFSRFNYRTYRPYAIYFFIFSLLLSLAVFIPGIGLTFGGASRWISFFGYSFQPSELLKIASVVYIAAWLAGNHTNIKDMRYGFLPFVGILAVIGTVLILQPDTDTFVVIAVAAGAMYVVAGAPWRDIAIGMGILLTSVAIIALARPYVMDRMLTFINPGADPLGSGYQIQQSLIAIGSGELFGRGFGQSIQKFSYLPEPIGDSIFSVAAEEFGFMGGLIIIGLFSMFAFRGLKIATNANDIFGGLLVVGIVILIVTQSFMNIASMLGVIPLTGMPLLFISHGGSALFSTLAAVGIALNVSRYAKNVPSK